MQFIYRWRFIRKDLEISGQIVYLSGQNRFIRNILGLSVKDQHLSVQFPMRRELSV